LLARSRTLQAKPRQPKPPKLAKIEQHQFYPLRLTELQDQEIASQCLCLFAFFVVAPFGQLTRHCC
jgi:hypothetical protein